MKNNNEKDPIQDFDREEFFRNEHDETASSRDRRHLRQSTATVEHGSGNFKRGLMKYGAIGTLAALAIGGAYKWIQGFNIEAGREAVVEAGSADSRIFEDVSLQLAGIESEFPLQVAVKLERKLRPDCNMQINYTGKEDQEDKIMAYTTAGLIVDSIAVERIDDVATVTVKGDIDISSSEVDYNRQIIKTDGKGWCTSMDEANAVRHIADVAIQNGGGVATACALRDELGKQIFEAGIRDFVMHTDMANDIDPDKLTIDLPDYQKGADAAYGQKVEQLSTNLDVAVDLFVSQTKDEDHKVERINTADLVDCSKHTISAPDFTG
ncbi:hypothetical protein KC867_00345 [Candidatus Saccharibacteria bacterium]|nr:hypothetical protein [Candidatus Saccharibacteria bacterium]